MVLSTTMHAKSLNLIPTLRPVHSSHISSPNPHQTSLSHLLSILKSCHDPSDLPKGRQAHAQLITNGILNSTLSTRLLGTYVLCKSFPDAATLFSHVDKRSPLPWNWMIRGFTSSGLFESALLLYFKMRSSGAVPDNFTYPYVIKSCYSLSAVNLGRLIHRTIRSMGLEADVFVGSALIKMYAESGFVEDAREVFDGMPERDCVLWNVMIDGYVKGGDCENAVGLFCSMRRSEVSPNSVSFKSVLSVCAARAMVELGMQIHGLTVKSGLDSEASVGNTLLAMYSKCRCLSDVSRLFGLMPKTDLVTWNGMISGYVQNGLRYEALDLFYRMQVAGDRPDGVTLASLLPAFSDSAGLNQGKEIHAYIVRSGMCMDAFLKSALIDIYSKCKAVLLAQKVFDATGMIDVVICSAMISGYVLNGMSYEALRAFRQLLNAELEPNPIAIASIVPACSCLNAFRLGKELHSYALKKAFVGICYLESALVDLYSKCGRLDLGHQVFKMMPNKDAVAWNTMITSFAQNGQPDDALTLFCQMGKAGVRYDCVTVSSALSACAGLPALHCGKEIHGFMTRVHLNSDVFAESALIDMYSKCGHMDLARRMFDLMHEKNEVSWNSIISAYGSHGLVTDAVSLFQQMRMAGFRPDHITFLALISASGHAGQVEEGLQFFSCMSDYGIAARIEHYACMVDLFGRAGRLNEALHLIKSMPTKPDAGMWGALLGACRVHRNTELAEIASKHLFELDPQNSGYYILLSNIHAVAGMWDGVKSVRSLMRERRVHKVPGCSWIDINNISHVFISADTRHPDSTGIYLSLKSLLLELRAAGYIPKSDLIYPTDMGFNKQVVT